MILYLRQRHGLLQNCLALLMGKPWLNSLTTALSIASPTRLDASRTASLLSPSPQIKSISSITLQEDEDLTNRMMQDAENDSEERISEEEKTKSASVKSNFLEVFELPDWLKLLKFKDHEVLQLVLRHPCIPTLGPNDEVEYVIELFRKEGVSLMRLRQMIMREPLTLKRRKQLEEMLRFYQDMGATRKECMKGLIQHPHMLRLSVDDVIRPRMQFLMDLGLSAIGGRRILRNFMNVLGFPINTSIASKLECFEKMGLPKESVLQMIERFPGILQKSVEQRVDSLLKLFASLEVNLSGNDLGLIFRKCPPILSSSVEHKIEPMLLFFRESGFSAEDIRTIATRHPSIFCLSLENQIKPKFDFAKDVLGKSPQDMARNSDLFTYSFEDRILWRIGMLQWAGKEYKSRSLGTLFGKSEKEFEGRFSAQEVADFKAKWNLLSGNEKLIRVVAETGNID